MPTISSKRKALPFKKMNILLTRLPEDSAALADAFIEMGHDVVVAPVFGIKKIKFDFQKLKSVKNWVFTSQMAIQVVYEQLIHQYDLDLAKSKKIWVVGPKSRELCRGYGWNATCPRGVSGAKDLLLALKSKERLSDALAFVSNDSQWRKLHPFSSVVVYEKQLERWPKILKAKIHKTHFDAVLFFSPSAVEGFVASFSSKEKACEWLQKTSVWSIGVTTGRALSQLGIDFSVIPMASPSRQARWIGRYIKSLSNLS